MARICDRCGLPIVRDERWAELKFRSGRRYVEHVPACPERVEIMREPLPLLEAGR